MRHPYNRRELAAYLCGALLALLGLPSGSALAQAPAPADPPAAEQPLPAGVTDEYANSQRVEGWRADLLVLATQLPELHADLFANISETDWRAAVDDLGNAIPRLSDSQVICELARIVNLAGDSHTTLDIGPQCGFRFYPLGLYWFADGLYVVQAREQHRDLLGARLTAIDDHPLADVLAACAPVIPHENESQLRNQAPYYLVIAEVLQARGMAERADRARFSLTLADGRQGAIELAAMQPDPDAAFVAALDPAAPRPYYEHQDLPYFSEWLPLSSTLYIACNAGVERDDLSMAQFTKQTLEGLAGLPEARVIVDLRGCRGGDAAVLTPLSDALAARPEVNRRGRLFALIGRRTFAAGVDAALELQARTAALLIGEPTGGKPSHFDETQAFKLPISGLTVEYATKYCDYRGNTAPTLPPDVVVEQSLADYLAGRDVAVAAAVNWQP